jgi:ABC-type uncharacterized transport system permease subunit
MNSLLSRIVLFQSTRSFDPGHTIGDWIVGLLLIGGVLGLFVGIYLTNIWLSDLGMVWWFRVVSIFCIGLVVGVLWMIMLGFLIESWRLNEYAH